MSRTSSWEMESIARRAIKSLNKRGSIRGGVLQLDYYPADRPSDSDPLKRTINRLQKRARGERSPAEKRTIGHPALKNRRSGPSGRMTGSNGGRRIQLIKKIY